MTLGKSDTVRCLLDAGLTVNEDARRETGITLMRLACLQASAEMNIMDRQSNRALALTCVDGAVDVASVLIRGRADVNAPDGKGMLPLMTASRLGYSGITCLLLQFRADARSWDADGVTALMLACAGGHSDVVSDLTDAEADVNAWADQGMTPLMFAANRKRLSTTTVFYGIDAMTVSVSSFVTWSAQWRCFSKSACIDDRDIQYRAALMFASVNNDSAKVSLLLGFEAEVDSCADIGWTVVGLLLEARANANRRREDGAVPVPLHFAVSRGRTEVVTCLLPFGYAAPHSSRKFRTFRPKML